MTGATTESTRATARDPALYAILALAIVLRLPGLFTDFWLDEIWTWRITLGLGSWLDVFTHVHHSNNHHLNTLFFYLLGDTLHWSLYRIPSLIAGVATVGLAWAYGRRRSRGEAVVASLLCALSYLLVHFSSEARGYSMAVAFALCAFLALLRFGDRPSLASASCFWLAWCLGLLSHLLSLHVLAASAVFLGWTLWRRGAGWRALVGRGLQLLALPAAFALALWWIDLRLLKIGPGPDYELVSVVAKALSYAGGGPGAGAPAIAAAAVVGLAWLAAIVWHFRRGHDEWIFFAVIVFVAPAAVLATRPDVLFVRYFLLCAAFGNLAWAGPLARGLRSRAGLRVLAVTAIALFALGNGVDLTRFYRYGRGDYLDTLRSMAQQTQDREFTVGGDHEFRLTNTILFYRRYLPRAEWPIYLPQDRLPEWLLLHRIGELGRVDPMMKDDKGHFYRLVRVARYSDLSGWHWLVYRRMHPEDD